MSEGSTSALKGRGGKRKGEARREALLSIHGV